MARAVAAGEVGVPQHVLDYLDRCRVLTLATATATGIPRATTLSYVHDGLAVYVWTRPDTATARQLQENPSVFFALAEDVDDWREAKGIQAAADAQTVLNPDESSRVIELFGQKYPSLTGTLAAGVSLFRLTPTDLQFIDNTGVASPSGGGGVPYARDAVFSVFRDLPQEEEIETVRATLQTIQVAAGEVIVRQGAPADKFFIIVDGEVEVLHAEDAEQSVVARLTSGQFFGEIAILRDRPRIATVRAVRPTTLFAMERDAFRSLVAQSLGTTQDFDRMIERRIGELGPSDDGVQ